MVPIALAACTAATPSVSTAPVASIPPAVTPSSTPVPSPTPQPSPSPTSSPTASPLAAIAAAPAGRWSRITWLNLGSVVPLGSTNVGVYGWSHGFVALEQTGGDDGSGNPAPIAIRASASSDGAHWSAPRALNTSGLTGSIAIQSIVEGPHDLLAMAFHYGDTCGGPEPVVALWTSTDGAAWSRVTLPRSFRTGQVLSIVGGGAGYLATGDDGTANARPAVWTSLNGRTWTARPLPTVSSGQLVLDGGASFDGGFVLVGAVLGEGECGGPAHIHPAAWWSADGAAWTRTTLPGASTAANTSLQVGLIARGVLMAGQSQPDGLTYRYWTSTDGRTWTKVGDVKSDLLGAPDAARRQVWLMTPDSGNGPLTVQIVNDDGSESTIPGDGAVPAMTDDEPSVQMAVGPTGILLLADDGSATWLGLPS
jgi:hypothetical protein